MKRKDSWASEMNEYDTKSTKGNYKGRAPIKEESSDRSQERSDSGKKAISGNF